MLPLIEHLGHGQSLAQRRSQPTANKRSQIFWKGEVMSKSNGFELNLYQQRRVLDTGKTLGFCWESWNALAPFIHSAVLFLSNLPKFSQPLCLWMKSFLFVADTLVGLQYYYMHLPGEPRLSSSVVEIKLLLFLCFMHTWISQDFSHVWNWVHGRFFLYLLS